MRIFVGIESSGPPIDDRLMAAAAHAGGSPVGKWVAANLDLKTILAACSIIAAGFGCYSSITSRLATLEHDQPVLVKKVSENTENIATLTAGTVSRKAYEHDTTQLDLTLNNLATGQQNIFNLLVEGNMGLPHGVTLTPIPQAQGR